MLDVNLILYLCKVHNWQIYKESIIYFKLAIPGENFISTYKALASLLNF